MNLLKLLGNHFIQLMRIDLQLYPNIFIPTYLITHQEKVLKYCHLTKLSLQSLRKDYKKNVVIKAEAGAVRLERQVE